MRRRTQRRLFLLAGTMGLAIAAAGFLLALRLHHQRAAAAAAANRSSMRLPFALPCSGNSGDAGLFYAALRHGDRRTVKGMFAAHKITMIGKGTALSISGDHPMAMVTTQGDPRAAVSCFIPADVVPAIERKAYQ